MDQGVPDGLDLRRDDGQHGGIDPVKLVEAAPRPALREARENLPHGLGRKRGQGEGGFHLQNCRRRTGRQSRQSLHRQRGGQPASLPTGLSSKTSETPRGPVPTLKTSRIKDFNLKPDLWLFLKS